MRSIPWPGVVGVVKGIVLLPSITSTSPVGRADRDETRTADRYEERFGDPGHDARGDAGVDRVAPLTRDVGARVGTQPIPCCDSQSRCPSNEGIAEMGKRLLNCGPAWALIG